MSPVVPRAPLALRSLLLSVVPAALLVGLASAAVWGDGGYMARERLRAQLEASNAELAAIQRENERLLFDLRRVQRDPVVMERVVAEEIGMAREGSIVVRFEGSVEPIMGE